MEQPLVNVQDFMQREQWDDAGVALGMWLMENFHGELSDASYDELQQFLEGIEGEIR